MKTLFLLICLTLISIPCPCMAGASETPAPKEESVMLAAIKRIAKGITLYDRRAKNLGFTIKPTKAFVSISF